jgi:hypothetical protein
LKKLDILINIIAPLLIGLVIYHFSGQLKEAAFIRNQFPDGLWAYALSSSVLILWDREIKLAWLAAISVVFIMFEAFQYMHLIAGVGDVVDVVAYFIFFGLSLLTNIFLKPKTR